MLHVGDVAGRPDDNWPYTWQRWPSVPCSRLGDADVSLRLAHIKPGIRTKSALKHTTALSTKDSFFFAAKLLRAILNP